MSEQNLLIMIRSTILFFIILWGIGLRAQVFNLGMDKGLSNSSVKCITKDSKGYMWFGTADGLNRYNGYEIRSYRNKLNNIQSLPHNYIYCVTEDKIKNLWIGTGQGVAIYNRNFDSFSRMKFHPHWDINDTQILQADAKTIEVDEQNNVFVGTNGWGMFEKESNKIIADWIPLPINKKEYTYYYHVTGIRNTQNGIILVFINEHGIFIFDKKTKRLIPVNDQVKVANIVTYNNEDQRLYIGNDNGVYVFDTNTRTYVNHITTPSVTSSINCIGLEGKSNLWIGTQNNGVLVWDLQNNKIKESYNITAKNNNLSSNVIYSLYIDSEKRKWIGTGKGGIDIIDQAKHRFLTENFNISNSSSSSKMFIRSFAEKDTERIWIGSEGDGLLLWNYKEQKFEKTNTAGLPSNNIKSLLKDKNETLWLGADIGILKKVNENFIRYHCYTEKGEENRDFEVLFEDKEGTIWAAAFSNGKLYKYVPAEDKFKLWCPKLIDIMAVSDGPNNSLWAGNYHQLIQIDKKTELFKTFEIGKPVRSIYMDSKNRMWIGTEGKGLLLFNSIKGQIEKTFADDEGLVNNSVLSIQEDADGNLWLSTFSGLTKFNPSKGDFSNYDQSDGLQSNEFSYGASLKLKDGRMAFGGINGFNIFDPKKIKTETRKPPVVITEIRINNTPLNDSIHDATINKEGQLDLLTLPFSQATLSLNFAALEYSSPQRIRYRYKLEGWDKTWN
ncbi:ligand-binding sensor domain-containing protein, partial [Sphingobacterium siyangense]|uniref:ligand-binding sensor domain-containing protein n=1 Tax=Sphingobacterium siyangense TaxID=459529 RepID=UPI003C71460B